MATVLLSGATGFLAGHTVQRLLAAGHEVVGTVRNPDDADRTAHLRGMDGAERLRLVAADLTAPDPFHSHVDVDGILHMASPYVMDPDDPQRDLVRTVLRWPIRAGLRLRKGRLRTTTSTRGWADHRCAGPA